MKRNLLSVLILALLVVNIVLTGIMMFSVVGTSKKTSALVTDIATILQLEIGSAKGEGKEEIRTYTIDKQKMESFREKFPFWKSAD